MMTQLGHQVSVDEDEPQWPFVDDEYKAAAFCEDCSWRGEWHHADGQWVSADAALEEAEEDAATHREETTERSATDRQLNPPPPCSECGHFHSLANPTACALASEGCDCTGSKAS